MIFNKLKLFTYGWLVIIALAFAALTPTLNLTQSYLTSDASSATQHSHSNTGGQAASPNPGNSGFDQEERVRQMLAEQYEQRS